MGMDWKNIGKKEGLYCTIKLQVYKICVLIGLWNCKYDKKTFSTEETSGLGVMENAMYKRTGKKQVNGHQADIQQNTGPQRSALGPGNQAMLQLLRGSAEEQSGGHSVMPAQLRRNLGKLSASLSDVRVHYNSSKPAQVQALAYTQGNQIYIGPGQEKHLPHELTHVVQQKEGRVEPTGTINGMALNEDPELEREAEEKGMNIAAYGNLPSTEAENSRPVIQRYSPVGGRRAEGQKYPKGARNREEKNRRQPKGNKNPRVKKKPRGRDPKPYSLTNHEARKWYLRQERRIPQLIDPSLRLKERAKIAFELRNQLRTKARKFMRDREEAERLNRQDPNLTWKQIKERKWKKGMRGDEVFHDIIASSQRSRKTVNKNLGF